MESEKFPKIQYYEAIRPKYSQDEAILSQFSPEQQKEILKKQDRLSVLAYFIGRDFHMPILLNAPGAGWHWNFKDNHIKIDTKDLLEKPMDYLRFVICHEGGHRRVSRTDFIPKEIWNQTGFPFLMNAIEDPRMNNFVADAYSAFEKYMEFAYEHDFEMADKFRKETKEKLGFQPKHIQAGLEYIRLWFYDRKSEPVEIAPHLPDDVKDVIRKTLEFAKDSWWTYPSKQQADKSEVEISRFAEASYRINLEEIWPEFKKLVEDDKKNSEISEKSKDMQGKGGDSKEIPKELSDKLTEGEQKALEEALDEAIKKNLEKKKKESDKEKKDEKEKEVETGSETDEIEEKEGGTKERKTPIDIDSLPDSLKQKIKEYIESLPEDEKKELEDRAEKALKESSDEIAKSIEGEFEKAESQAKENLEDCPQDKEDSDKSDAEKEKDKLQEEKKKKDKERQKELKKELEEYKKKTQKILEKDQNSYNRALSLVAPIITSLENELRQIFVARRGSHWETGYKFGKKIDIKKRIQEKAKGVSVFDSKSWQKRELPKEKDYAISLLVDLSSSMGRGGKIEETFKAVIVLAEVLNKLGIKTEILGFNDRIHEYQSFGEKMSNDIRSKIGNMLKEVNSERAMYNDDGWALGEASARLDKEKDIDEKILIVLSDGVPEESGAHSGSEFDLNEIVKKVVSKHSQRLIGLGIGQGTSHVKNFYPQSIADINVEEMADRLADLIKDVIEHPKGV